MFDDDSEIDEATDHRQALDPIADLERWVGQSQRLSPTEENRCLVAAQNGDREAAWKVVFGHLKFVLRTARSWSNHANNEQLLDLFQEGVTALWQAVFGYNLTRIGEIKFLTYAAFRIEQAIKRAASGDNLIDRPIRLRENDRLFWQAIDWLTRQLCRRPTNDEVALHLGITEDEVTDWLIEIQPVLSLDEPRLNQDGDEFDWSDWLNDEQAIDPAQAAERAAIRQRLEWALTQLMPGDAQVVRWRFGLDKHGYASAKTLTAISKKLGITREGVRLIEHRALEKLKDVFGNELSIRQTANVKRPPLTKKPDSELCDKALKVLREKAVKVDGRILIIAANAVLQESLMISGEQARNIIEWLCWQRRIGMIHRNEVNKSQLRGQQGKIYEIFPQMPID